MTRFYSKNVEAEEMCGSICPKIRKKLNKNIDMSNNCTTLPAGQHIFHVKGMIGEYEVNIQKEECSCRAWQLSGIPCRHGAECLRYERIKPEVVVNKCYSIGAFKAAYGKVIMPCSDPRVWPRTNGPPVAP
uniref:SWIM-type domain-containing protein n=1 Tax=Triticum urartu TaxID=4572 RepID=A0A8R7UUS5_TRIUA